MAKTTVPRWLANAHSSRHQIKIRDEPLPMTFGYARYSDAKQHKSSILRQKRDIKKTVVQYSLPDLTEIFVDEAMTGKNTDRRDYQKLLRSLKDNPGSYLVVENVDRLLRSRAVLGELITAIEEHNIQVYHSAGPVDRNMFPILGTIAVIQNEEWRDRARFRIDLLRKEGAWMGAAPFGLKRKKKHIMVPDPALTPYIQEIAERFVRGESYRQLAVYLYEAGVPTPRGAKFWRSTTVKGILLNPMYCGFTGYQETD